MALHQDVGVRQRLDRETVRVGSHKAEPFGFDGDEHTGKRQPLHVVARRPNDLSQCLRKLRGGNGDRRRACYGNLREIRRNKSWHGELRSPRTNTHFVVVCFDGDLSLGKGPHDVAHQLGAGYHYTVGLTANRDGKLNR